MKVLLREFLAALKEREELDAILPDLLSELGYNVISRPGRGTRQHGVDVAAVGTADDGQKKLYLFSVKQGDLGRADWNNDTPQALRPSLDEIQDAYLPNRVPAQYKALPVVICICVGGEILESVADDVRGYETRNTSSRLSFEEWNGDKIAELLLTGVLREELLPKALRSHFQKAVAMVDEPEVSYYHFRRLLQEIVTNAGDQLKLRATASRLIGICLWVLFVWARQSDNLEAPYRCSELALLTAWELTKPAIGKRSKPAKALATALHQIIRVHVEVAAQFLDGKVMPHTSKRHALSAAVPSHSYVDINLKLFELLGRMATTGLWLEWMNSDVTNSSKTANEAATKILPKIFELIGNNPALLLPLSDAQSIEVAATVQLAFHQEQLPAPIRQWLTEMAKRVAFSTRTHGKYPCSFTEYADLAAHPKERSNEYREEATLGSTLLPYLACWLSALGETEALKELEELSTQELQHCTLQLWLPDEETEQTVYLGGREHGIALCDLRISGVAKDLIEEVADACKRQTAFGELSAIKSGYWPIVITACRHHRLPIPPHFWIEALT